MLLQGYLRRNDVARRSFRPLLEKSKCPRIQFHDLRHTSATLLLAAGEHVEVVSERPGHSSARITLDVYGHVLPTMQDQAAEKMASMLG